MQSGAPTFGTPEPSLVSYGAAQLARRLGLPFRTGGSLCASKIPDAQAAYESVFSLWGAMQGGWLDAIFGPLRDWIGNSMVLHQIHRLGMWAIVVFMLIHIYAAIREDILSRQSMVSTMISGHRTFKDDRAD